TRPPSAGGTSADDDILRLCPLPKQPAITTDGVFKSGGKSVFGRQAVVERENPDAGLARKSRCEWAMSRGRARNIPAAVQVIDRGRRAATGSNPLAFDRVFIDLLDHNIKSNARAQIFRYFHLRTPVADRFSRIA